MKNLFKCLTLLIVVLTLQGCPMWEPSLKSQITGVWQCNQIKNNNGNIYNDGGIWNFYSSGKLTISGVEERPNGLWQGTWKVDEDKEMLYIDETNGNRYNTALLDTYQVKSINSSSMKLFTGSTNDYWMELTFSKYKESETPSSPQGGTAGAPKK